MVESTPEQQNPVKDGSSSSLDAVVPSTDKVSPPSSLQPVFESMVRVTLAGFGGSLVGLAHERQMQQQEEMSKHSSSSLSAENKNPQKYPASTAAASSTKQPTQSRTAPPHRHAPPSVTHRRMLMVSKNARSLPATWAISCTFFALILEVSRVMSPTNMLWQLADETKNPDRNEAATIVLSSSSGKQSEAFSSKEVMMRMALTGFGDYTLGGAVAGLAGGMAYRTRLAQQQLAPYTNMTLPKSQQRGFLLWGMGVGMALGMLAGLTQASIDVGNMYMEQKEMERQQESVKDIAKSNN